MGILRSYGGLLWRRPRAGEGTRPYVSIAQISDQTEICGPKKLTAAP